MSSSPAIKTLLLATISATIIAHTWSFQFNFPSAMNDDDDDDDSQFFTSENSDVLNGVILITPDYDGKPITNMAGRVVYKDPFKLRNNNRIASFNTTFALTIDQQTFPAGGEGLAFIMAAEETPPPDSAGKWLGIVNESTNGTEEARIVAVEFDTRKNFPEDIDSNHVGLNVNSVFSINQQPLMKFGVNLSSGSYVFATVRYDGENISIYVSMSNRTEDQMKNLVIFQPLDLSVLPDEVYVGFSASTSNYTQLNQVKSWQFQGTDVGGKGRKPPWVWIATAATAVAAAVVVLSCGVGLWMRRRRLNDLENGVAVANQIDLGFIAPRVKKFGLTELRKATNNFDPQNKLGKGGFGTVYRGVLMNKEVAVKRVSKDSRQGKREFIAEVATIGRFHHKNLVKLIGWCYKKTDLLLVYEYMPNGSLEKLLFGDDKKLGSMASSAPNWERRCKIIHGVAEALEYLHNGCERSVLHRDVKSSNIMLDSRFEAKLGDFGLARAIRRTEQTHHSTRQIAGTPSYMAPETFLTSRATAETDVYAFGVLVLEVICGRKPGNPYELGGYDGSIAHWAWEFYGRGEIVEAVDVRMEGEFEREEMEDMLILGLACCHPNPHWRPTMRAVLQVLDGEANPPSLPRERPSFVWPPMPPSFKEYGESSLRESQPFTELTGR